jgi:hypothetical protein
LRTLPWRDAAIGGMVADRFSPDIHFMTKPKPVSATARGNRVFEQSRDRLA